MKLNKPNTSSKISSGHKVFDVSKPGGSAPNTSGRPLIVTHRPIVQDPMVNAPLTTDPDAVVPEKPRLIEKKEPVLTPPKSEVRPSLAAEAIQETAKQIAAEPQGTQVEEVVAPALDGMTDEPAKIVETATEPVVSKLTNEPEHPIESTGEPVNDGTSIPVTTKTSMSPAPLLGFAQSPAVVPEQTHIAQEVTKTDADEGTSLDYGHLVDNKKYYVHVASSTKKRSMQLAVTGAVLIILVAIGCVDAMLDAGVMNISSIPHTHFIQK